jgi:hypothetical protein
MLRRLLPLSACVVVLASACACASSTPTAPSSSTLTRPIDFDAGPPRHLSSSSSSSDASAATTAPAPVPLPVVARPENPAEAGLLVGEAMAALQRGEKRAALPRLQALLRSEFLSERGRANLYWLLAEAALGVDDGVHRDALGGYLVAASILPADVDVVDRRKRARAELLVEHVTADALGRSPEQAIDVDNLREADVVVAALPCGQRGGRYVARATTVPRADDGLAMRRLLCTETGDELVLWFRLP